MALMPSIRELFGSTPAAAPMTPAQAAGAAGANNPVPGTSQTSNPTVPSSSTPASDGSVGAIPAAPTGDASPLAGYKEIWKADPSGGVPNLTPEITADPAAMMAAAQKMDFTKVVNPEMLTKAMSGDKEAFAGVMNSMVQAGFAQAATASANITRAALAKQQENFEKSYAPNMLRNEGIAREVQNNIPLSADPAAAPIVAILQKQLAATYPTATPAEIASHVDTYLGNFARSQIEASGGKVQTKADLAPRDGGALTRQDTDWTKFFDFDPVV